LCKPVIKTLVFLFTFSAESCDKMKHLTEETEADPDQDFGVSDKDEMIEGSCEIESVNPRTFSNLA
jgi:hypothetical protein